MFFNRDGGDVNFQRYMIHFYKHLIQVQGHSQPRVSEVDQWVLLNSFKLFLMSCTDTYKKKKKKKNIPSQLLHSVFKLDVFILRIRNYLSLESTTIALGSSWSSDKMICISVPSILAFPILFGTSICPDTVRPVSVQ